MFVLIWVTVCFFLRGSADENGSSVWGTKKCQTNNYCVTLHDGTITAEAGLCAVILCSFTSEVTPKRIIWYKCEQSKCDNVFYSNTKNDEVQSGFKGRVSLLEPDVSQKNCSIIISDLKESDSGLYQLRVEGTKSFTYTVSRASLSVTGLTQKPTVVIPPLTEGQESTLTCTAPGLCSGSQPKITWTWRKGGKDSQLTGNITAAKTENLTAVTQRHSSTLTFNLSAEHHGTNITCQVSFGGNTTREETVTLNVKYKRKLQITGNRTVKPGGVLHLICSIKSFPPSLIMWTKHSPTNLHKRINFHNDTGSAALIITNVTEEDAGQYICTAKHLNDTVTTHADVRVMRFSKILKGSGCVLQSKVLTCVCISEGVPLPTIKWPLLEDNTEYSVFTSVSNNAINSTVSVSFKNHGSMSVECFSSNNIGEAKENLTIKQDLPEKKAADLSHNLLKTVSRLEVIIAFLIGVLLSSIICCLGMKCYRKKQKNSGSLDETLECQHGQFEVQEVSADKASPELNNGPADLMYASIEFSRMDRSPRVAKRRDDTETEYAGVKTRNETKEDDGEVISEGGKRMKNCVQEVEGGPQEAVYSNVKDLVDETRGL
ncbi:sialic acid-binding Ig-like lectin 14 [Kryptolebias marmoratus]|uniref:sialic acid-binding Ig-like lectin 14 n=1 Tax=Kryptolebias marmoratus TaxID=37003 RepID=UPI0018AC944E|nr:sialic acid-binding Ig-like lectin 14 [Kryptolebias marmoratus]